LTHKEDIDYCVNTTCMNGASCVDGLKNYTCSCAVGFTGNLCETDTDGCVNHTCENGGTCVDGVNSYSCICPLEFTGDRCESATCKLPEMNIKHIQVAKRTKNRYRTGQIIVLGCKVGYKGIGNGRVQCNEGKWTTTSFYCERIDYCVNATCKNSASCVNGLKNYTCSCAVGFTGDLCEIDIDDCVNHTCENGGTCVDGVNSYSCICPLEFTGDRCESAT